MKLHDLRLGGITIASLLLATAGVAAAQPAPAEPVEPPVGDVAAPADPTAPPVEGANDPVEPSPEPAPEPAVAVEAPAAPAKGGSPVNVSYDKGLSFASEDEAFHLKITFRNQIRLEVARATDDGEEFESHFVIPRSRLQAEGNVFGKSNRYKLEFGLGDRGSFSFVKDLFIEKKLGSGGPLWLRVGQWKRPFNRQELVSDFASEFNERAITADFVGGGRDLGISLHNDYEKSPDGLEWALGVFNGFNGGADRPRLTTTCTADAMGTITCVNANPSNFPADFGPTVAARLGWNMGGIKGYSEGDLEGGPLRLAAGVSYKIDLANLEEGDEDSTADNLSHGAQADVMLKVEGLSVLGGVYLMKLKSNDAQLGGMLQAGYFLSPKKIQVAGRFAMHQTANDDLNEIEARAAFNWYFQGHAWKLATDIGFLDEIGDAAANDPEIQGRIMAQLTL
jgi:hypothetical protein